MAGMVSEIPACWRARAAGALRIESPFRFDPTYGYGLDELLAVEAEEGPKDFGEFWGETYVQTLEEELALELPGEPELCGGWHRYSLDFFGFERFRVGAWLMVPAGGEVKGVVVKGHGYGGCAQPEEGLWEGMAMIQLCGRGFGRSARDHLPAATMKHVVHGIEGRERYLLRGCVADIWSAVTAAQALYAGVPVFYYGASFGGGLGMLALGVESRLARAYIGYPTFGNQPLRLGFECTGSGAAVRLRYLRDPAILETLRYYDSSTAARRVTTPTLIDVGCFDPAVPPPGQFAVFNPLRASGGDHRFTVHTCHHFEVPESKAEVLQTAEEVAKWFNEVSGG